MITKEQFLCYLDIQSQGIVSMYDTNQVSQLSYGTLTRNDVKAISKNYSMYSKKYS
jgi:hypothetical protein